MCPSRKQRCLSHRDARVQLKSCPLCTSRPPARWGIPAPLCFSMCLCTPAHTPSLHAHVHSLWLCPGLSLLAQGGPAPSAHTRVSHPLTAQGTVRAVLRGSSQTGGSSPWQGMSQGRAGGPGLARQGPGTSESPPGLRPMLTRLAPAGH